MSFDPNRFKFKFSDPDNVEFAQVSEALASEKDIIALYGEAGTGKSTFIRELTAYCADHAIKVQCLAFTGRAAGNIAGRTLHSYFGLELRPYLPTEQVFEYPSYAELRSRGEEDHGERLNEDGKKVFWFRRCIGQYFKYSAADLIALDLLVIDEVSMVRCDLLDACDILLRKVRVCQEPFGGVKVLLVGDKRQLPPVVTPIDLEVLKDHYAEPFDYTAADVMSNADVQEVVLQKVYRQKDAGFVKLLRGIRLNGLMPPDIELLNLRLDQQVVFEKISVHDQIICSTNALAGNYNERMLDAIRTEVFEYQAEYSQGFPEREFPTEPVLRLKLGAKVMLLRNDKERRYFNGSIAQVRELQADRIVVEISGREVEVLRNRWVYQVYRHNKKERSVDPQGMAEYFFQFPLRLAWAMTTHKVQGQTFDRILCDLSDEFMPEHAYVTLSRCTSLEGITLLAPLHLPTPS